MYNYFATLAVLFFLALGNVQSFTPADYTDSTTIPGLDYQVYWTVNLPANSIHLAFKVKTLGWVGFGIGELSSGSMPGADIIMGHVQDGVGYATDRWSYARVLPVVDDCQDVVLVGAEETGDGYTILEVKRPITTPDTQDRSIVPGPNRVIVAFSRDGSDTYAFHGPNRLTSEITFYGEGLYPQEPTPNEFTLDLRINNYLVPDVVTQYACQTFAMPVDQDYHITQIEPLINEANVLHVHHFVAHVVMNATLDGSVSMATHFMEPKGCMPLQGQVVQGWVGMLSAWAAGGGSQYTPPQAGFPMGQKASSLKFIILEIHYNNPTGIGGYVDNSGIRIHYTTNLRQYDADVLIIGDPFTSFAPIPAGQVVDYESECLSSCTQTFPSDLNVFGSFPHMHQAGTMAWSTQWRDGVQVREIGRIEYFSYNHQQVLPVNFTIQRGDRFNTHCIYDTRDRTEPTRFGMASTDEMCMHFFFYYPRMTTTMFGFLSYPNNFCGRFYGDTTGQDLTKNGSICGSPFGGNYTQNQPLHYDPPGGMNKTFGESPSECFIDCANTVLWSQTLVSTWNDGVKDYSQWSVTLNVGTHDLYATEFSVVPPSGNTLQNLWSANSLGGGVFAVPSWVYQNGILPAHSSSYSFGYITTGLQKADITITNEACHAPAGCTASVSAVPTASWQSDALYQQYAIQVENHSSKSLAFVEVEITLAAGTTISTSYGLQSVSANVYKCLTYNLAPGGTYHGCGYTVRTPQGSSGNTYTTAALTQSVCV